MTSKPVLDFVGGSKFTTDAEFTVSPDEGGCKVRQKAPGCSIGECFCVGGVVACELIIVETVVSLACGLAGSCKSHLRCLRDDDRLRCRGLHAGRQVLARVTCAAAGPWGLITTIENIMAEQAADSVRDFLHYCAQRCMMHRAAEQPLLDAQPELAGYASDLESSYELFQDAAETMSVAYPDTPRSLLHAPGDAPSYTVCTAQDCLPAVLLARYFHKGGWSHLPVQILLPGVDAQQLEHLVELLQKQANGMESTISSLQAALLSALPLSARSAAARGSAAPTPAVFFWAPLLAAFAAGACFGMLSSRNSALLWRR